jgi:hypothetical protein
MGLYQGVKGVDKEVVKTRHNSMRPDQVVG